MLKTTSDLVNIQPWYFREARLLYQEEKIVQDVSIQNLNNKACEEGEEINHLQTLPVRVIKHFSDRVTKILYRDKEDGAGPV